MATLSGNTIASTFGLLLKIDSTGLDSTLREVEDGDATASPLYLSTADVAVANGAGLIVGSTTVQETVSIGDGSTDMVPEVQVLGTAAADSSMLLAAFSTTATTAGAPNVCLVKGGNATIGSHTVVTDGEELGNIIAFGDDGTDLEAVAAQIQFEVDGTPGTGDMPGRIILATTADGAETATERLRVTAGGDVHIANGGGLLVGHTAQETISIGDGATDLIPEVQVLGTGQVDSTLMLASFSATATSAGAPMLALVKGGNASIGSHTVVTDGEELGNIIAFGDDGTDLEAPAAMIQFEVDGTPGTGDMPGRIIFATTTDAGETLTERVRISAAGLVTVTGNIVPEADGTRDLGSASLQWQNVYTEDLNLNNTGRDGNEVDGTTGHWVIQEGDENLFLLNRKTGKQYKFSLEEIV